MLLYYAQGGGLGHIRRTMAVLHTLNMPTKQVILVSNSSYARPPYIAADMQVISIPHFEASKKQNIALFLQNILHQKNITQIWLDAFPLGLYGEWEYINIPNDIPIFYVARLLQWVTYSQIVEINAKLHFEQVFCVENLLPEHQTFVDKHTHRISNLALQYPTIPPDAYTAERIAFWQKCESPFCLIIHSEPLHEIEKLLLLAYNFYSQKDKSALKKPLFLIISPTKTPKKLPQWCFWESIYPLTDLYPYADSIFTACGFNTLQELKNWQAKHYCLPFERRFDDQAERFKGIATQNQAIHFFG